jgi:hypothetical protein
MTAMPHFSASFLALTGSLLALLLRSKLVPLLRLAR